MKYYIIAGEASGDLHASNLIRELKALDSEASFRCWGGDLMQKQGGVIVKHIRELAFMGFLEVVAHLPEIMGNLRFCEQDILQYKPDVLILVDYPGFNLRIAKFAAEKSLRVFYYISPQLWAWKSSRVKGIRKYVEHMFVILPFEQEFYTKYDVNTDFPGHPLLDVIHEDMELKDRKAFIRDNGLGDKPIIALLPGSRKMEIKSMLSVMLGIIPSFPGYQFVIASAPSVKREFYTSLIGRAEVGIVSGQTYDLLSNSVAALVTSGTATLETALMNVPQLVCYKGNPLSYQIARRLVKVDFISLVNLIAGYQVVKELIQGDFNPLKLEGELKQLLGPGRQKDILEGYGRVKALLGGRGASGRTASKIIQYLSGKSVNKHDN
ncbi:MAG: lipid-A-disaccharide synthase [Bacteroidetes bacterium]|nr:lipid-A-disaccharide synthase [Bacteroidota bacterium]